MLKFVQRQPKNARVDDSITNSTSISVAIELLPEVSSGPIEIVCPPTNPRRVTRIRTTGKIYAKFYLLFIHRLGLEHRPPTFHGKCTNSTPMAGFFERLRIGGGGR